MEFSNQTQKIIQAVSTGTKISGRLTSQITEQEKSYFRTQFGVDNFLAGIYCFVHNSEPTLCLCCGNKTEFKNVKVGFNRFCSVSCATKTNNKINNSEKNSQKSKNYFAQNLDKLVLCSEEYCNKDNIKTISELAKQYNITYSLLRKYLSDNNLIKFGDIKQKRQNKKTQENFPELFDKTFFIEQQERKKSSKIVSAELGVSPNTLCVYARKLDTPFKSISSSGEFEVKSFFKELTQIEENSRKVIYPYELDIFLPKFNIAVEYNGAFWHSEENGKDKNYHINKQISTEQLGIKLIQIFDFEWANRKTQIQGYFNYLLGNNITPIYARKTVVSEISSKQSSEFLNLNHIHGAIGASKHYGLFFNNELVSVLTLGKSRFTKKYDYEVVRFCNKLNTNVIGGLSKLISYIKHNLQFNTIVSYTHRRLFDGNSFLKAGFELSHKTEPGYFWANKYSSTILSRHKTQKHKLNTELTESEYMKMCGYVKIWDCGQLVFIFKKYK